MFNPSNETISKLSTRELLNFDVANHGIYTYTGVLKCRAKGFQTKKVSEKETHFICNAFTFEVIKLTGENEYAVRMKYNDKEEYEEFWEILWGCDLFKVK